MEEWCGGVVVFCFCDVMRYDASGGFALLVCWLLLFDWLEKPLAIILRLSSFKNVGMGVGGGIDPFPVGGVVGFFFFLLHINWIVWGEM